MSIQGNYAAILNAANKQTPGAAKALREAIKANPQAKRAILDAMLAVLKKSWRR